ncbi:MAG TPA: CPBP family intramembrane metalloprotease [Firmicutes bacterium]|nr:CPBP family intramembrane metalloprotease [Candidatus Fermentithermobacillaceae bacterium]
MTALIFAAGHIPDFVLRVYPGMLPLAMGQVASVALYGAFLGYGVYRSGMLWPWMVVHALSDVTGI